MNSCKIYFRLLAFAVVLLVCGAHEALAQAAMGTPPASREAGHLRSAHRRAVLEWLKSHEDLRVARVSDCTNRQGLKNTREYMKSTLR